MVDTVLADDGCRFWTDQIGHGHPLVFCHGGPGLWDMFGDLARTLAGTLDALAGQCRMVRWDQRGCGRSERRGPYTLDRSIADLEAVRRHLAVDRMALLGHSWGATLALWYALRHPGRVSALVYVNGTGIDADPAWHPAYEQGLRRRLGPHRARWEQLRSRARTPREEQELAILQWSAEFADDGRAMAHATAMATPWLGVNRDCNRALNTDTGRSLAGTDTVALCRRLGVPTLIIEGARDIRPRWAVDSLHRALPDARRVTLTGCGHLPWLDDPAGFREPVSRFLAGVLPTGSTRPPGPGR